MKLARLAQSDLLSGLYYIALKGKMLHKVENEEQICLL